MREVDVFGLAPVMGDGVLRVEVGAFADDSLVEERQPILLDCGDAEVVLVVDRDVQSVQVVEEHRDLRAVEGTAQPVVELRNVLEAVPVDVGEP